MKKDSRLLYMALTATVALACQKVYAQSGLVYSLVPGPIDVNGLGIPALIPQGPLAPILGAFANTSLHLPDGLIPKEVLELPALPHLPIPSAAGLLSGLVPTNADSNTIAACGTDADLTQRAVFSIMNLQPNNQVIAFARNRDGTLCKAGVYSTGGAAGACGIPCSDQNPVIAEDGYVFAINQGSADNPLAGLNVPLPGNSSVSVFRIEKDKLVLTDVVDTGGPNTESVAKQGDLVYVVNRGIGQNLYGPGINFVPQTVTGFRFDVVNGKLNLIPGSNQRTIDANGDAGQVGIVTSSDGTQHVVVSNRSTTVATTTGSEPDNIEVFTLGSSGAPVKVQQHDVGGDTPFGFRVLGDKIYLSMGGAAHLPGNGSSGVFQILPDGDMRVITSAVLDKGADTCWNAISKTTDRPYFYTSAYFDSKVGWWSIDPVSGGMTLINPAYDTSSLSETTNFTLAQGGLDMHITVNPDPTEFLYVLNDPLEPAFGLPFSRIVGWEINHDGTLRKIGDVAKGLPNSGFGLWAL